MPITFHPANHTASLVPARSPPYVYAGSVYADTPEELLRKCSSTEHKQCESIIRSSFSDSDFISRSLQASNNGFVGAAINAYNDHNSLIVRPDDVWLAILTQFNLYVNAHAEELRHHFVAHEGQKELEIKAGGTTATYNWAQFPLEISKLIDENVTDPELRTWILPDFTTTTPTDKVVCSIVMMSTLQHYFTYKCRLMCGIPSVTLQGEKSDWQNIMARINKLPTFGDEVEEWYNLLVPVISRFVTAFDDPSSEANLDFWQKIAHRSGGGSGPRYLSGWITAFCFWGEQGQDLRGKAIMHYGRGPSQELSLDGVLYHHVDMDDVPPGWAAVPVKVDDNGYEYRARMISGSVGIRVSSSGEPTADGSVGKDTLQPEVGWWMIKMKSESQEVEVPFGFY